MDKQTLANYCSSKPNEDTVSNQIKHEINFLNKYMPKMAELFSSLFYPIQHILVITALQENYRSSGVEKAQMFKTTELF